MERNNGNNEETREICETATRNIAKCVANWEEQTTKSKKTQARKCSKMKGKYQNSMENTWKPKTQKYKKQKYTN